MRFSGRTAWDLEETPLARAVRARRANGSEILDLTASNPTQCGFIYDEEAILAALADSRALIYDPNPRGMLRAREAVCRYCAERGAAVQVDQVFLTTGTSEGYSWLFRLLCDSGDEVLIAQPSYPLFDFLAQIEDVRLVSYPLLYDHGWQIDLEELGARVTPRTRAIAVVHPNNPTGHWTRERAELEALCVERGLALILDEVFLDYSCAEGEPPLRGHSDGRSGRTFAAGSHPCLTFVLSGISKIAALPQMKAAWICAFGPDGELRAAAERLEVIADTFLSMNAPVQCALSAWLDVSRSMQKQIRERTQANLRALDAVLARHLAVTRLKVEAGWYAVIRVPALGRDEDLAVRLVEEHGVSVHPGYFFGFNGDGWLVVSLLTPEEDFVRGVEVICGMADPAA
ncbi:MAG TPA: pyridoxal phosphate-dependent aminotransferase [Acidobacteriaceae bacterium]|nr:pyridoxal phosphate-dependent aminotransferase [Acidobacteriaceae bacterium]